MPGVDRIESLFDTAQIQQEFSQVKSGLADSQKALMELFNTTKQYKDTTLTNLASNTERLTEAITGSVEATTRAKTNFDNLTRSISAQVAAANQNAEAVNQSSQAYDQLIKQAVRNKISLDELSASQAQLKKAFQAGTIGVQEYESSLSDIKEAQISLKTSNADLTKTLNNLEKQAQASGGSLNQMRATLNLLTQSYDKLSAAEQQSAEGQGLQKTIQTTTKSLMELEVATGRNRLKIGDYTGALKILEAAAAETNAKLQAMTEAGQQNTEAFAQASGQAEQLNAIVSQQENGFSSVTMQIRSLERALQTLRASGMQDTEMFEQLRMATASAAQSQKEFQRQQKLLEGEAPALGALILAARGLGGAYAVSAGATQLFASDNEHLQKELNKLVAIMTLLQGLNEAYATVQQFGAITTALKEASVKGLTLATSVLTAVTGEAAEAITAFDAALVATGIGAVIALISVAIVELTKHIGGFSAAEAEAAQQSSEFYDALQKVNEALASQIELSDEDANRLKKNMANAIELAEKNKQNQQDILTLKKASADLDAKTAEDDIKKVAKVSDIGEAYKIVKAQIEGTTLALTAAENKQSEMAEDAKKVALASIATHGAVSLSGDFKKIQDANDKEVQTLKKTLEEKQKYLKAYDDAQIKSAGTSVDLTQYTEDEKRKMALSTANLEVEYNKFKNDQILADNRSSLGQRLAAIRDNSKQEIRAAEAAKNDVLSQPGAKLANGQYSPEALIAIQTAATKEREIIEKNAEDQRKLRRSYYERDRDAALQAAADVLNDDIKNNDAILYEEKTRFQQRNDLINKNYQDSRAIIGAQMLKDLDQEGLTNQQRLAIQQKYQSDLHTLDLKLAKDREAEQKREQEKQIKDLSDFHDKQKDAVDMREAGQIISLNDSPEARAKGLTGLTAYNKKLKDIEFQATQDRLQVQIEADYAVVNSYKQGTKERADAEAKLSKDVETFSTNRVKHQQEDQKKLTEAEIELGKQGAELIKSAIDDRYENELNHIQKLTEANDRARSREIEGINSSTLSEQEKANAIIIANARIDAQNKLLADRAKKIKHDEAVADKAYNVAKAIEEGIVATLKAFADGGPVLGAIVAATAAIQVAEIIATPIPAYKTGAGVDGKPIHPGGLALVHKDELIVEPGKSPYMSPGDNVIMDLKPFAKVIPAEKIRQMDEAGLFINRHGRLISKDEDDTAKEVRSLKEAMIWQTQRLESALAKNSKRTIIHNYLSNDFVEHITKNVYK